MHILVGLFSRSGGKQDFCKMSNIIDSASPSLSFPPLFCAYDKQANMCFLFQVFKNLKLFMENKQEGDDLFDRLNVSVMFWNSGRQS